MNIAFIVDSVPFTKDVIAGTASLGGSESACVGLARGLARRGHTVQLFVTKIEKDAIGLDASGVAWRHLNDLWVLNQYVEFDVVCALRTFSAFAGPRLNARLRILWNEDLLVDGAMKNGVMASAWQLDKVAYVSAFHRRQWEELLPELAPLGWVTRNGFDPSLVPTDVTKDPNRIIHISRPERGLRPLLKMWPAFKRRYPQATLGVCRYSSMYDPQGWGEVCKTYDREIARLRETVGGIEYLGELGKPALYRAIAEAAVMWYPGVADFAETSCIAAIESQACGTPFVGSLKGALPETAAPAFKAGHLFVGNAETDEVYQLRSMDAVASLLAGCADQTFAYRKLVKDGRAHVASLTYDALAAEWESAINGWFVERFEGNRRGVLNQLLHEDDHTLARRVAEELGDTEAVAFCDYIIAGKDHTAEDYGAHSASDPIAEAKESKRFHQVAQHFVGVRHILDVACGNGAFAIAAALADPAVHVTGLDYSAENIDKARTAAETAGLSDRLTFQRLSVYDFDAQTMTDDWRAFAAEHAAAFDGLFVGEFLEHCAGYREVIDGLEVALSDGAKVVYTMPNGPLVELIGRGTPIRRGHVHRFADDDITAVFGAKDAVDCGCLPWGHTVRGYPVGNWLVGYLKRDGRPAGRRPEATRIVRTRPMARLSVGLITKNAETDLARCLTSVWPLADEIVVGDTGSTDKTREIAAEFGARVLTLPDVQDEPDGFSGVRNAVLDAATGDWFLWIDADEVLVGGDQLRKYIECGGPYRGISIHQTHLSVDLAPHYDRPVRLFRRDGRIRFFGVVHEQPGDGDANTDITPALEVTDCELAHTGYLTEGVRKAKMLQRNLPLLLRDRERFPDRTLGLVLVLRDYVNLADHDRDRHNGQMTNDAWVCYQQAIALFDQHFTDPAHKLHSLARPWYERALQGLGQGIEVEYALAGRQGGLQRRGAKPLRAWVRTADEMQRLVEAELRSVRAAMEPAPMHVDPFPQELGAAPEATTV